LVNWHRYNLNDDASAIAIDERILPALILASGDQRSKAALLLGPYRVTRTIPK
jgi:hypothetical protein